MKQEEPKWLSRWEEQELPSLDELVPLSKALIPPDLALAFDIPAHLNSKSNYGAGGGGGDSLHQSQTPLLQPSQSQSQSQSLSQQQQQVEYDSSDVVGGGSGSGGGCDEHERTLKKPRLVWTPQLHKRFVDAVGHLGIKNAVPKTIMQLMSVDGLKRENVASHLQKYRLYLKRMQGHSSGGLNGPISAADSAMDHLFASAPVPHHFLNRVPPPPAVPGSVPFTAPPGAGAMQQHHHQQQQQQMLAAVTHQQQHYHHQRHIGQLGSPPGSGFDLGFQPRHPQQAGSHHRMLGSGGGIRMVAAPPSSADGGAGIRMMHHHPPSVGSYAEDLDSGCNNSGGGGRRVLSLFPAKE